MNEISEFNIDKLNSDFGELGSKVENFNQEKYHIFLESLI